MCNYQTLYHDNKSGYVIRCEECENLQVTFGNIIITFGKEDFNEFIGIVKELRAKQQPEADIELNPLLSTLLVRVFDSYLAIGNYRSWRTCLKQLTPNFNRWNY